FPSPLPRAPRLTLFPYTTLFRSGRKFVAVQPCADERRGQFPTIRHAVLLQPRGDFLLAVAAGDRFQRRGFCQPGDGGKIRAAGIDRKSTRLNSSHVKTSYAVFCL